MQNMISVKQAARMLNMPPAYVRFKMLKNDFTPPIGIVRSDSINGKTYRYEIDEKMVIKHLTSKEKGN